MLRLIWIGSVTLLISCKGGKTLDITKDEIDDYVAQCLDTALIYDINLGPRYSKDDNSYQAFEYSLYDTLTLHTVEEFSSNSDARTNIYYKENLPIYIEEYIAVYEESGAKFTQRKIYLNGRDVIEASERSSGSEDLLSELKYKPIDLDITTYDLNKARNSVKQEGEFALQFEDFLTVGYETYLLLSNEESNYHVALYIVEGDDMIDKLYSEPLKYKGKTFFFNYQFVVMAGIERMVYKGVEEVKTNPES
jgi:hypothetical protein